jgi:hypothetical protein
MKSKSKHLVHEVKPDSVIDQIKADPTPQRAELEKAANTPKPSANSALETTLSDQELDRLIEGLQSRWNQLNTGFKPKTIAQDARGEIVNASIRLSPDKNPMLRLSIRVDGLDLGSENVIDVACSLTAKALAITHPILRVLGFVLPDDLRTHALVGRKVHVRVTRQIGKKPTLSIVELLADDRSQHKLAA